MMGEGQGQRGEESNMVLLHRLLELKVVRQVHSKYQQMMVMEIQNYAVLLPNMVLMHSIIFHYNQMMINERAHQSQHGDQARALLFTNAIVCAPITSI
jgi:hypothetical protein